MKQRVSSLVCLSVLATFGSCIPLSAEMGEGQAGDRSTASKKVKRLRESLHEAHRELAERDERIEKLEGEVKRLRKVVGARKVEEVNSESAPPEKTDSEPEPLAAVGEDRGADAREQPAAEGESDGPGAELAAAAAPPTASPPRPPAPDPPAPALHVLD